MQYIYHCYDGQTVSIFTDSARVVLYTPNAGRAAFDPDQYTGFIQREFIRLVESGAIPKLPAFTRDNVCPECGNVFPLHSESCSEPDHAEGCPDAR